MRLAPLAAAAVVVVWAALQPAVALAQGNVFRNWNSNVSGPYTDAFRWTPLGAPAADDSATFDQNANFAYTVTFPGRPILQPLERVLRQIIVGTNTVTFADAAGFNELPASLKVDDPDPGFSGRVFVGDALQPSVLNTTLHSFAMERLDIGFNAGQTGVINLNGGNTGVEFLATIGNGGVGTLNVNAAAVMYTTYTDLGEEAGSSGTLNVNGGQFYSVGIGTGDKLQVGVQGAGTLNVTSGGKVAIEPFTSVPEFGGRSVIGVLAGSQGTATVSGAGSEWTNNSSLTVGSAGLGNLTVQAGGRVASQMSVLGKSAGGAGIVAVTGAGSTWETTLDLIVGEAGDGRLIVSNGAQVTGASGIIGQAIGATGVVRVENPGSRWAIGGDLTVGASPVGEATLGVTNGGIVSVGGLMLVEAAGSVFGNGTLDADVVNFGVISPGAALGTLAIDGSFQQAAGGRLQIELGGNLSGVNFDQLAIAEQANLRGTLEVTLAGGFTPTLGQTFTVVTAPGGLFGQFTALDTTLPSLGGVRRHCFVNYTPTEVQLVVVGGSFDADFDEDGDVDGSDLVRWKTGAGMSAGATHMQGDANQDGAVDGSDFLAWQRQLGSRAAIPATIGVPEPQRSLFATAALGCIYFVNARRRNVVEQKVAKEYGK